MNTKLIFLIVLALSASSEFRPQFSLRFSGSPIMKNLAITYNRVAALESKNSRQNLSESMEKDTLDKLKASEYLTEKDELSLIPELGFDFALKHESFSFGLTFGVLFDMSDISIKYKNMFPIYSKAKKIKQLEKEDSGDLNIDDYDDDDEDETKDSPYEQKTKLLDPKNFDKKSLLTVKVKPGTECYCGPFLTFYIYPKTSVTLMPIGVARKAFVWSFKEGEANEMLYPQVLYGAMICARLNYENERVAAFVGASYSYYFSKVEGNSPSSGTNNQPINFDKELGIINKQIQSFGLLSVGTIIKLV